MGKLQYAQSFRDLLAYQEARTLAREIFEFTKRLPPQEKYSLTDQIRRSSCSVGAQIAEAWAKRRYEKHFISKLTDADGEQQETQHWIETAVDCGYLTNERSTYYLQKCQRIGRLLGGMIAKSNRFCGQPTTLRESAPEYFISEQITPSDYRSPITDYPKGDHR
jgi:four helix bundle protein